MALTFQTEVSDGVRTTYSVGFDFLSKDTIYVYTGAHAGYAEQITYRWVSDTTIELINVVGEVPAGTTFYIRRIVEREKLVHTFADKSIRGALVDAENKHLLFLLQEFVDGFTSRLDDLRDIFDTLDMNGNRITNLGAPLEPNDAATVQSVFAILDSYGIDDESKRVPQLIPRFNGNQIVLETPVLAVDVYMDGRLMFPDYRLDATKTIVELDFEVTENNQVIVMLGGLQVPTGTLNKYVTSYATVAQMQREFTNATSATCVTLAYNKPVLSTWSKVFSGAGDMSDGTLALDGGGYAKLEMLPLMDVRAFGTHGNHDPDSAVYVHDDSVPLQHAINLHDNLTSNAEDTFAVAQHVRTRKYDQTLDFSRSEFQWYGQSGPAVGVGRTRAMFEIFGDFGEKIQESGPWAIWREGADTMPSPDTSVILEHEFILFSVGRAPLEPGESYMIRPMLADPRKTDVTTRFQTDYRLGWDHVNADFRYFSVSPAKNVHLSIRKVVDKTNFDYDERDIDGNRKSASATSMVYTSNCSVKVGESDNFQYPTVMTYVVSDCAVEDCFLLPSVRESDSGVYGWGIIVQWNNALRPYSKNLSAQGNRRCLDYTAAAYAYAESIGGESTRDGEMTTHGVYEHNLTYVNTRGFMSFANSGPDFGESTKDITVVHHHGSDIFAVTNVLNLSLKDCRANSIRVNSVGLVMDNCSLYDSGRLNIDNLCQINNWSAKIGKPYKNIAARINKSKLGSNGVVYLVDRDIKADEFIYFTDCDIELREGDFAGPANVRFSDSRILPKPSEVNNGRLILVSSPTSLVFDNCDGYNVGLLVPEAPFIVNGPTNVTVRGGTWIGRDFGGSIWGNQDQGSIQGNSVKFKDVNVDWDNDTASGMFYDPLATRNINWHTEVTDCELVGANNEEVRIPALRGTMRFGNNTLRGVTKNIDALSATRLEYNTLEL